MLCSKGPLNHFVLLQIECIRGNVLGVLNLADVTNQRGLHMTNFATGCIFHYDDKFTIESGKARLLLSS